MSIFFRIVSVVVAVPPPACFLRYLSRMSGQNYLLPTIPIFDAVKESMGITQENSL